jgi:hypothetical protein
MLVPMVTLMQIMLLSGGAVMLAIGIWLASLRGRKLLASPLAAFSYGPSTPRALLLVARVSGFMAMAGAAIVVLVAILGEP